jgi:hypothetical protein
MHGLALAEGVADISLGFFHCNLSRDNQLDIEVLRVDDFVLWFNALIALTKRSKTPSISEAVPLDTGNTFTAPIIMPLMNTFIVCQAPNI